MRLPRLLRPRGRHRAPATATFTPHGVLDGSRWLVCDTTACAHLTTRHQPTHPGWTCTECHTLKGDPS
ncbi:hypothetical protein [Streptomyces drozdowiczii]|uniref:Uncharacterized protein n=1 Tax=Streptomyces drozdowiczii TaxID=202862 RepID=A0ABY6PPD1_9ACTN|nr:hypothetical protein [Streptomyces drozdowiczii]MCX0246443.1 hypothetical protein [Streptomyces drozdowiczii]UZK54054.1 hypothetical protein NEH16_07730 [Streptomyces drozdowiczii]